MANTNWPNTDLLALIDMCAIAYTPTGFPGNSIMGESQPAKRSVIAAIIRHALTLSTYSSALRRIILSIWSRRDAVRAGNDRAALALRSSW